MAKNSGLKFLKFPKRFLWGTATSSYQVEGRIYNNDWHEWETSRERLNFLRKNGMNLRDYVNDKACRSYNLYEKDFDLARKLGNNAYRFSIEWARIEPEKGKFNEKEIEHYRKVIKALRKRKLEPFLTCYHFTLPAWLAHDGGWLNPYAPEYFAEYVRKLAESFPDVKFWITINEPMVLVDLCYREGKWPPNVKGNFFQVFGAMNNLILAHKKAYKAIHSVLGEKVKVSLAVNLIYFQDWQLFWQDYLYNWRFLNKVNNEMDFIGMNYYTRRTWNNRKDAEKNDMGWDIYPEGIYFLLRKLRKYNLPVYITENGIADYTDSKRGRYILEHLKNVHKALKEKVDVRGYFYWSLLDNFEWDDGFTEKFGLVKVDFMNMKRTPKKSYYIYRKICRDNGISVS